MNLQEFQGSGGRVGAFPFSHHSTWDVSESYAPRNVFVRQRARQALYAPRNVFVRQRARQAQEANADVQFEVGTVLVRAKASSLDKLDGGEIVSRTWMVERSRGESGQSDCAFPILGAWFRLIFMGFDI